MKFLGFVSAVAAATATPAYAAEEERKKAVFGASYITDLLGNIGGGERKGVAWMGRADLTAEIDGSLFGLDGATAFFDLMFTQGPDFSGEFVGDAQVVSNVQADRALRPFEAWLSVPLGGGLHLKSGLIDLNTEFDIQEVGGLFLNSSHGVGPEFSQTGVAGPSIFPATSVAFLLKADLPGWTARLGIFDAVAGRRSDPRRVALRFPGQEGALIVGELDVPITPAIKLQTGAWTYTSGFSALADFNSNGTPRRGSSHGGYFMLEHAAERPEDNDGLDAWARVGVASDTVNPVSLYLGGGATYGNAGRKFGLAVAHARLGDPAIVAGTGVRAPNRAETAIEATASFRISDQVTIQPDLQYVINPGWEPSRSDALVAGIRFKFDFGLN
jgi:porin